MPGMGKVHFPVTSKKPEVQAFIDQGVGQLHSFLLLRSPSDRSARPPRSIPTVPWPTGAWRCRISTTPSVLRVFSRKPASGRAGLERRESLYLEALESFFKEGDNAKTKRQNWLQGLETIVQEFPGDIDARAWLAMVTWQNAMDGIGSRQAVDTLLDTVLQVEPMHPGAHHYRIHLWDGPSRSAPRNRRRFMPGPRPGSPTPGTCRATPTRG